MKLIPVVFFTMSHKAELLHKKHFCLSMLKRNTASNICAWKHLFFSLYYKNASKEVTFKTFIML